MKPLKLQDPQVEDKEVKYPESNNTGEFERKDQVNMEIKWYKRRNTRR